MTIFMMQRIVPHVASENEPASNLYSNFLSGFSFARVLSVDW